MIVFTNGCFDVLHKGHLDLLKYCKSLGKVVVGLNSDDSVKRLKGSSRPVNNVKDRKYFLDSLVFVDEVIVFKEDTPYNLIKKIKPDIIVKGGDYKPDNVVGNDSTTSILENKTNIISEKN
jgi:rfaE bifunctional protein nucleotidyltransferase chain/domain